jgi:guanyl-specific ribonuclease Sa
MGNPNSQRLDTGSGPYQEWTVKTPDVGGNGKRRIVVDKKSGKAYYTHDHYDSFIEINLDGWN